MATRDLSYLITFDVTDSQQVATAAEDMEALNTAASELGEAPEIDLSIEGVDTLPEDIGEVGGALDELPIEETTSRWDGLTGIVGDAAEALGEFGLGKAIGVATGAFFGVRQALEFFSQDAEDAEQRTRDFSEALLETSGLLDAIEGSFEGEDPFSAFTAALLELGDVDIDTIVAGLGDMGRQVDDLGSTLIDIGTSDDLVETFYEMAEAAGVATDGFGVAQVGSSNYLQSVGDLTDQQQEFLDGFNTVGASLAGLDLDDVARQQLEVAEGYDAISVAQARADVGPDASDLDVWARYQEIVSEATEATEGEADASAELAEQQAAAASGAEALSAALSSIAWQDAEVAGATSAMSAFSEQLFAVDNATQTVEEAFAGFADAVGDDPLNFDVTAEAGRRQQDALEAVASALDTQFVQAYDAANGSQEAFIASATEIGDATLARLQSELNLSTEEVDALRVALGLTEGDYEARFELSADATAIERLQLLQAAIAGLPPEVSTRVSAEIAAGDPQEALRIITDFFSDPANFAEVGTELDVTGAQEGVAAVTDGEYVVEFDTTADTATATEGLDAAAATRTTEIEATADTAQAESDISAFEDTTRTISTYLSLVNGFEFDTVIDNHTDDRTITVNLATGSINLPSASEIVSLITGGAGVIRIPIDTYVRNTVRLNGTRATV